MSDANVQDDCKCLVVETKWLCVPEIESLKDIHQCEDQTHCFDKKGFTKTTQFISFSTAFRNKVINERAGA